MSQRTSQNIRIDRLDFELELALAFVTIAAGVWIGTALGKALF